MDIDISALYQIFLQHPVITTDSRNCPEGAIFFALKGENFNGNKFARQALEKGCAYAIVDEDINPSNDKIIVVGNSLKTLQQLANYHRRQLGTKIIGITGTNGKTTTKELIAAVLAKKYVISYTQGNLNNQIGVPLTLLQLKPEHELAIIEMGASHPGDIKELVEIAEPDYGIITNIGKGHLLGFGSFENIISTKGELFDYLRTKEDSTIFIHQEDKLLLSLSEGLKKVTYGSSDDLYVNGSIESCSPTVTIQWKSDTENKNYSLKTQLIGTYNLDNIVAAITIGKFFGISSLEINQALEEYTPSNNRSQLHTTPFNHLIIDAYNANPTSMTAALKNFQAMEVSPKMVILGDMKELGDNSKEEHQQIIELLKDSNFQQIWLVGEEFKAVASSDFISFNTIEELIYFLKQNTPKGFWILIKGSNSIKLKDVIPFL